MLVAVLGGGQLGRMLALAGIPLGLRFRFLDPSPDAAAGPLGELVVAPLGDRDAVAATAKGARAVTYEWEGVPAPAARAVADAGIVLRPGARSLEVAQDRLAEKVCFEGLGIPVPAYAPVDGPADLDGALRRIGLPAVLKGRRGGYDGKGQAVVERAEEAGAAHGSLRDGGPLIVEARVDFDRELSVLAVRGADGDVRCWPLVENHHERGILRVSRPAADVGDALLRTAHDYARRLAGELDHVGVLALELFQVGDRLLANELAPRVHNSGHWTIEGATTSQFENHLRAVLGWPLGPTGAAGEAVMVNCIGVLPDPERVLAIEGAHLHHYGKVPRPGRKVGHVTVTAPDASTLAQRLDALRAVRPPDDG